MVLRYVPWLKFVIKIICRKQIQGSFLSEVEWVHGDLNDKTSLAPAVKGAKKIIFCAGAHGW